MSHTARRRHSEFMSPRERRKQNSIGTKQARACHGKMGYPSKRVANGVIRDMHTDARQRDGHVLQAYKCKLCGSWHVGNSRTRNLIPRAS